MVQQKNKVLSYFSKCICYTYSIPLNVIIFSLVDRVSEKGSFVGGGESDILPTHFKKKDADQTQKTPVSVTPAFTMTTKEVELWGFELKFIVTLCSKKNIEKRRPSPSRFYSIVTEN